MAAFRKFSLPLNVIAHADEMFELSQQPPVKFVDQDLMTLERRLDDGYRRIENAKQAGQSISAWEEFWIQLLHEYETLADDLAEAA